MPFLSFRTVPYLWPILIVCLFAQARLTWNEQGLRGSRVRDDAAQARIRNYAGMVSISPIPVTSLVSVFRIWDVYPGSRIFQSWIQGQKDSGSASKNISIINPKSYFCVGWECKNTFFSACSACVNIFFSAHSACVEHFLAHCQHA